MPYALFDVARTITAQNSFDTTYTPGTVAAITPNSDCQQVVIFAWVFNSDTIPHLLSIVDNEWSPPGVSATFSVPAGCGVDGVHSLEIVSTLLAAGNQGYPLGPGIQFDMSVAEAITAGTVRVYAVVGRF